MQAYEMFSNLVQDTPTDTDEFTQKDAQAYLDKLSSIARKVQEYLKELHEKTSKNGEIYIGTQTRFEANQNMYQWGIFNLKIDGEEIDLSDGISLEGDIENVIDNINDLEEEVGYYPEAPADCEVTITKEKIKITFNPLVRTTMNMSCTI